MKVFLSFSETKSQKAALALRDWLPNVIQSLDPWISYDIKKGVQWFGQISKELSDAKVGILCLTKANRQNPWLLFEAGALGKGRQDTHVCTFLLDLEPMDLEQPLGSFQHTTRDRGSFYQLLETLNYKLEDGTRLQADILERAFGKFWPDLEKQFDEILKDHCEDDQSPVRPQEQVLAEILDSVRALGKNASQGHDLYPPGVYPMACNLRNAGFGKDEILRIARALGKSVSSESLYRISQLFEPPPPKGPPRGPFRHK